MFAILTNSLRPTNNNKIRSRYAGGLEPFLADQHEVIDWRNTRHLETNYLLTAVQRLVSTVPHFHICFAYLRQLWKWQVLSWAAAVQLIHAFHSYICNVIGRSSLVYWEDSNDTDVPNVLYWVLRWDLLLLDSEERTKRMFSASRWTSAQWIWPSRMKTVPGIQFVISGMCIHRTTKQQICNLLFSEY